MAGGRSLTRVEFDAVIRRAAELASSDRETPESGLSEEELFRIAGEVGLSEDHVRQALVEVRAGVSAAEPATFVDRVFGPAHVHVSRVVPGTPEALAQTLDDFLVATQLLHRVRRSATALQYRPATDWASQVARATSARNDVASSRSIEVRLDAVDENRTLVAFVVEPGTRGGDLGAAVFGGGLAGGAAGVLSAFGLAIVAPGALAVAAGAAIGTGVWSGIFFATGAGHRRKVEDVRTELEGLLDTLEIGAPLEPPAPAWRKWVKRHFRGVARDILGDQRSGIGGRGEPR